VVLSSDLKQLGNKVDHLPPSNANVKNEWNYTSDPPVNRHDVNSFKFTFLPLLSAES
jgi:hypothetical protein